MRLRIRITHCQHAQAVVSIHQFYTHYRVSLCDHCCYCCRSIWGTCCSLLLWEVTVEKFVVSSSTIGHDASSAFAILWTMPRSQGIETLSELLHMFSSLVQFHWFIFLATPNGVLCIFERTFWILWCGRIISIGCKIPVFGFSWFWNLGFVWANKSSCMKALDSNQSVKTIKFSASSRQSCGCRGHCSLSWGESFLVAELRTPSDSRSCRNPSRVKTLTVFVTTFEKWTMLLESSSLTGGCVYIFLSWDSTMTVGLPNFLQRISQAW